jgi:anhydro-N-acetylmuramic acid kinase
VINDFRSRDICLGGQGAPLVPIYHFNLLNNYLKQEQKNIGVLNIGGVSNLTLFNKDNEASLTGFDVCFGNSVFDDLIQEKTKKNYDQDGKLTMKGKADIKLAKKILENEIFFRSIPRSFDRQDFTKIVEPIKALELDNALATYGFVLTKALEIALGIIKIKPEIIFICGGGRKNKGLTNIISENLVNIKFIDIDKLKLDGDSIEAEAFAFLAIRNLLDLPISFSKTTGLKKYKNSTGGIFYNKTNS